MVKHWHLWVTVLGLIAANSVADSYGYGINSAVNKIFHSSKT